MNLLAKNCNSKKIQSVITYRFLLILLLISPFVRPQIFNEFKLLANDASINNFFGVSVSISGNRALIGSSGKNSFAGAAYVFDFDKNTNMWVQSATLEASDAAANNSFGNTVSLLGNRAIIGSLRDTDNGTGSGSAYIFEFDTLNNTWLQTKKLLPTIGAVGDSFGSAVSLSEGRVLVASLGNDIAGNSSGAVYVFDYNSLTKDWTQTQILVGNDTANLDAFGISVSLQGDRALIGSYLDDDTSLESGSAYIFEFDGLLWNQIQKLTANDPANNDNFGYSVSLFGDRALVSAYRNSDDGENAGSVYIFEFDSVNWNQTTNLTALDASANHLFGSSVALVNNKALIGAQGNDLGDPVFDFNSGAAYVFEFDGTTWNQTARIIPSDSTALDGFGSSICAFNNKIIVGAFQNDDSGNSSGSSYIFTDVIFIDGFDF